MNPNKQGHQFKALFLKNLSIQKQQPCTNCCQILTPIICLIFTILIRNVAIANIPTQSDTLFGKYPLLPMKLNDYTFLDYFDPAFIRREGLQWWIYGVQNQSDRSFIGERNGNSNTNNSGMLANVLRTSPGRNVLNYSMHYPFKNQSVYSPAFRESAETIDAEIFSRYQLTNNEDLQTLKQTFTITHIPDGAVYFKEANLHKLRATLRINDLRDFSFHRGNGITRIRMKTDAKSKSYSNFYTISEGFLSLIDMLNHAYIKTVGRQTVVSGYLYMPLMGEGSMFIDMLVNTVATILFPLSLSLLLPVFLYLTVLQKEQKLIQMMRMNGMKMVSYWSINFIYNLTISCLTNLTFCIYGYFFLDNAFFHKTSHLLIFIVLLGWILSQIGMATLFQVFLSNSRAANIIGYLISIWTNLIGATLSIALFQYPTQLPVGFALWPTFSFNRIFYLMFTACSSDKCYNSLDSLTPEMIRCIIILYVSFIVFSLIGMYLFEVIPQEFGVAKPILFPLHAIRDICFKKHHNKIVHSEKDKAAIQDDQIHQDVIEQNDFTVHEERQFIHNLEGAGEYALICQDLTKVYDNGKKAVTKFNLKIEDNRIFGLLGPNGAGKTTLLSMITGIFSPTSGNCYVGGYSIKDQIDQVHLEMGVCPQFDILWPILDVETHLYFYARLKGIPRKLEKQRVEEALEEVNLTPQRSFKVHQLSGGMKRRLSVGISLVGNPRIVFLDEPTTGLDPENRRHLWQVLANCRSKRSLLLTTHLMEEAEALCDRVGLITNGCIRTVGDQVKLKQIYGKGYFVSICIELESQHPILNIKFNEYHHDVQEVQSEDPSDIIENDRVSELSSVMDQDASVISDSSSNSLVVKRNAEKLQKIRRKLLDLFPTALICKEINGFIKINIGEMRVSDILERLEIMKDKDIKFEWSINNSTLEDVFLEVIKKFDSKPEIHKESLMESIEKEDK